MPNYKTVSVSHKWALCHILGLGHDVSDKSARMKFPKYPLWTLAFLDIVILTTSTYPVMNIYQNDISIPLFYMDASVMFAK